MSLRAWKRKITIRLINWLAGGTPEEIFFRSHAYVRMMCEELSSASNSGTTSSLVTRKWADVRGETLLESAFSYMLELLVELWNRRWSAGYSRDDIECIHAKIEAGTELTKQDWLTLNDAFEWSSGYLYWDDEGLVWWPKDAAQEYEELGKFKDAGEAWLKYSKEPGGNSWDMKSAAECFYKAGAGDKALLCYQELYRRFGCGPMDFDDKCIANLREHGDLEVFFQVVKQLDFEKSSSHLSRLAEEIGEENHALAAELSTVAWRKSKDTACLRQAIRWSEKAKVTNSKLRELYEDEFRTSQHELLPSGRMEWLWKTGELETFINSVVAQNPGWLWNELDDLIEFKVKEVENPEDYELVARLMLKCYEAARSSGIPFQWVDNELSGFVSQRDAECNEIYGHFMNAAQIYLKIGDKIRAAECLVKASKYEEAGKIYEQQAEQSKSSSRYELYEKTAYIYEKAGLLESAVSCYEKAVGEYSSLGYRKCLLLAEMIRTRLDSARRPIAVPSKKRRPLPKIGGELQINSLKLNLLDFIWTQEGVLQKEQEQIYNADEFDVIGKLYESLGLLERSSVFYKVAGRMTKADRLSGKNSYNIEETLQTHTCLTGLKSVPVLLAQIYLEIGDKIAAIETCLDEGFVDHAEKMATETGVWEWNRHLYSFFPDLVPLESKRRIFQKVGDETAIKSINDELKAAEDSARAHIEGEMGEEITITYPDIFTHFPVEKLSKCLVDQLRIGHYNNALLCVQRLMKYANKGSDLVPSVATCKHWTSLINYLAGSYQAALSVLQEVDDQAGDYLEFNAMLYLRLRRPLAAAECLVGTICRDLKSSKKTLRWAPKVLRTVAKLFELSGERKQELLVLKLAETIDRQQGVWAPSVRYYFDRRFFGEMERVCKEEDELDVAAYLFEQAGMRNEATIVRKEMRH